MKIDARRMASFLRDPGPVRVVLLYGEDEGLVRSRADQLTLAIAGSADDPFRVAWLARDDQDRMAEEASAIAMLGGRRVIRVRDVTDSLATAVDQIAKAPGDSLVILEAGALARRSKLVTLLEAAETADPDALDWLRDHLGGDYASTRGEVEKLILYAGTEKRLDLDAVRACVGDQASVSLDNALYAATLGDVAAADLATERSLADGLTSVGLIRQVLLFLSRLHAARGRMDAGGSAQDAVKAMRPPVFWKRESDMVRAVGAWPTSRLSAAMAEARRAELACKQTGAPDDVIARRLVMALARAGATLRR